MIATLSSASHGSSKSSSRTRWEFNVWHNQYLLHNWLMTGASGQVKNQSLQFSAPSSLPGQTNAILKLCSTSSIYNCIHKSIIGNLYFSVTRSQLLKLSILRCLSMILWMAFLSTTEGWATRSFSWSNLAYLFWRKVHYTPGKTPLVGWIKGYMVPELLGIEVDRLLA